MEGKERPRSAVGGNLAQRGRCKRTLPAAGMAARRKFLFLNFDQCKVATNLTKIWLLGAIQNGKCTISPLDQAGPGRCGGGAGPGRWPEGGIGASVPRGEAQERRLFISTAGQHGHAPFVRPAIWARRPKADWIGATSQTGVQAAETRLDGPDKIDCTRKQLPDCLTISLEYKCHCRPAHPCGPAAQQ